MSTAARKALQRAIAVSTAKDQFTKLQARLFQVPVLAAKLFFFVHTIVLCKA
jgi:hypothetical protein